MDGCSSIRIIGALSACAPCALLEEVRVSSCLMMMIRMIMSDYD
jgi:hypothetical protein